MSKRNTSFLAVLLAALLVAPVALRAQSASGVDPSIIEKIKDEGLNRSQVMQTLSYLTDVIGPRLTASPQMKRANEWTRDKMASWGLQNAHLEAWGPFGRGWTLQKFSMQVIEPQCFPIIAYPKAWSPGIRGTLKGEVVYVDARTEADLEKYKGKLKGAIILTSPIRDLRAHFQPDGRRYTDEQLAQMESGAPRIRSGGTPGGRPGGAPGGRPQGGPGGGQDFRAQAQFAARRTQFLMDEGAAALVDSSTRGDGGTIFVQSASVPTPVTPPAASGGAAPAAGDQPQRPARRVSPWDKDAPKMLPQITMASEHYNRLMRMLQQGEKPKMQVELEVKYHDADLMGYNTVAELPGSDLKDQLVMLGGHLDSWHSGTGATDNAAGCAVVMEAARILKALNLQPRRTIRVALWSGEEQGLLGSRAYVVEHFGSYPNSGRGGAFGGPGAGGGAPGAGSAGGAGGGTQPERVLTKKADYDKISGYFNLDNGTGKIRGIYLQGNEALRPIFKEWLAPFKEMGASAVTVSNTGGTDHQSFDGIGIPGFQFIQDEIEYDSRTHHSNQDVYDRIQADDMKQAAIIMATFIYQTAMRAEPLPRKTQTPR